MTPSEALRFPGLCGVAGRCVVVYARRMWPVVITVFVIVPLLVLAWMRLRRC
jgi:hypothetical protein